MTQQTESRTRAAVTPAAERASSSSSAADTHPRPHVNKGLRTGARVLVIIAMLLLSLIIFAVLVLLKPSSKPRSDEPAPLLVRAVPAEPRSIDRVWEGYGTAVSMRRSQVSAEVTGRVIERPQSVEAGGRVEAGGLLVAMDDTDYKAALARSEQTVLALRAQLDGLAVESERLSTQLELVADEIAAAERDLERTRQAVAQGAGSQGEIDQKLSALRRSQREQQSLRQAQELIPSRRSALEGELGAREADLKVAEKNVVRARVVSPIAGEIESVTPREGDWVVAGSPVATIVDVSRLEIPLRVPSSAASWIATGDPVSLWQGEPVGEPTQTGRVTRLGPAADSGTRTITVFVEVSQDPSDKDRLLPGTFVHGQVSTPDPTRRVAVPRRAIRSGRVLTLIPSQEGLYEVAPVDVSVEYAIDGVIESVDPNETEWTILSSGFEASDGVLIATTSIELLVPGARVRVDDGTEAQAASDRIDESTGGETDGEARP